MKNIKLLKIKMKKNDINDLHGFKDWENINEITSRLLFIVEQSLCLKYIGSIPDLIKCSAYGPFTKNKKRAQKFKAKEDSK